MEQRSTTSHSMGATMTSTDHAKPSGAVAEIRCGCHHGYVQYVLYVLYGLSGVHLTIFCLTLCPPPQRIFIAGYGVPRTENFFKTQW